MWTESDADVAREVLEETLAWYPGVTSCSFDKGFHSPANRKALGEMLVVNAMPRKGRLSKAARELENSAEFREARREHPAVESAINNLDQRGLDRVREQGKTGFERVVWMSVLTANCHRTGSLLRDRERERLKSRALPAAA